MRRNDEIEDGMGFAGLVSTAADRRADAEIAALRTEVKQLTAALQEIREEIEPYVGNIPCITCADQIARAALDGGK